MLQINDVVKCYDNFEAIHGISMEIPEGSIHGIIGENGSGKTTLIKCITGIYKPDLGTVTLDSETVFDNEKAKVRIGYIADNNRYFPSYKAGKMVSFFKSIYPKFNEDKFHKLNYKFGLNLNKSISELSKGQSMRLAFMLNIAANTDYLIMDEPTSGIDAMAKKLLFDTLIEEVEDRNVTVIISSHNLMEIERICDSVTIIKQGKVAEQNAISEVISNVRKFNIVLPEGSEEEFLKNPKIIRYSNMGKIYTIIFEKLEDEDIEAMKELNPAYMEELPVSLEDVFVYTNGGRKNGK